MSGSHGFYRVGRLIAWGKRTLIHRGTVATLLLAVLYELGNLWLSTSLGISRFNLQQKHFYNYDERGGRKAPSSFQGLVTAHRMGGSTSAGRPASTPFIPGKCWPICPSHP